MQDLGESYEVIFIDDGSTDGSFEILKGLHQKDSNAKVIRFTRDFGQHIAITAGFDDCKGENVIVNAAAEKALKAFTGGITAALKKGNKVSLVGFGTFDISKRASRTGRNPQSGETIQIKDSTVPKFKAGKSLKDAVN